MHELKAGLNGDKFATIRGVSEKFLSLIRFANDLYTLYNQLNASRLARFWKKRENMNQLRVCYVNLLSHKIFCFIALPSPNTKKNHPKWDLGNEFFPQAFSER